MAILLRNGGMRFLREILVEYGFPFLHSVTHAPAEFPFLHSVTDKKQVPASFPFLHSVTGKKQVPSPKGSWPLGLNVRLPHQG